MYGIARIHGARDDLAGDAEAKIGFVARSHHADEFAGRILVREGDTLHLYRALELDGCGGCPLVAGGEQWEEGGGAKGEGNLAAARDRGIS